MDVSPLPYTAWSVSEQGRSLSLGRVAVLARRLGRGAIRGGAVGSAVGRRSAGRRPGCRRRRGGAFLAATGTAGPAAASSSQNRLGFLLGDGPDLGLVHDDWRRFGEGGSGLGAQRGRRSRRQAGIRGGRFVQRRASPPALEHAQSRHRHQQGRHDPDRLSWNAIHWSEASLLRRGGKAAVRARHVRPAAAQRILKRANSMKDVGSDPYVPSRAWGRAYLLAKPPRSTAKSRCSGRV